jgi:hypothetical protein
MPEVLPQCLEVDIAQPAPLTSEGNVARDANDIRSESMPETSGFQEFDWTRPPRADRTKGGIRIVKCTTSRMKAMVSRSLLEQLGMLDVRYAALVNNGLPFGPDSVFAIYLTVQIGRFACAKVYHGPNGNIWFQKTIQPSGIRAVLGTHKSRLIDPVDIQIVTIESEPYITFGAFHDSSIALETNDECQSPER